LAGAGDRTALFLAQNKLLIWPKATAAPRLRMPRGSSDPSDLPIETPAGTGDGGPWQAPRRSVFDRQTVEALTGFAQELEARAAALEPAPKNFSHDAAAAVQRAEDGTDGGGSSKPE
jgi:hypothetical protein